MFNWKTRECVQEVLTLTFAVLLFMFAFAAPAKAFLPIGIAVGGAMAGSAMQDEANRRQQSQQSEQYQRSENGAESRHTKKAKNQKRTRDDSKIAKAKSPEPVANAPQAKPLNLDKFGE